MRYAFLIVLALTIVSTGLSQGMTPQQERALEQRMAELRDLESTAKQRSDRMKAQEEAAKAAAPELDSRTKERIRQMRRPDNADIEKYRALLAKPKTGIFKIFPNYGCLAANIVSVEEKCAKFVAESSDFSFRSGVYTTSLYHDLGYGAGQFVSHAFFATGVMGALGDVPIEDVTLTTGGVKYLAELKPAADPAAARASAARFNVGIKEGDMFYSSVLDPQPNVTYAIRSIAYKIGNSLPPLTPNLGLEEMKFHSLALDDRDDILVVFRVLRRDDSGGLTLIWRELARRPAPKLSFKKGETMTDFK